MKSSDQIITEWLVINCQAGDEKSLEQLYKRWNPKMLARVYHTTKDPEASKDIVQEAWILIVKKIKTLKDPAAFSAWSLRIATRMGIDWIRSKQADRKRAEIRKNVQVELSEDTSSNTAKIESLKRTIEALPEEQRMVIQLFYQESLSIVTISGILGVPAGTIKSRLFRAREFLKQRLEHKLYEDEKE